MFVGDTVSIDCTTSYLAPVEWMYMKTEHDSPNNKMIYRYGRFEDEYKEKMLVKTVSDNHYKLIIDELAISDAGY